MWHGFNGHRIGIDLLSCRGLALEQCQITHSPKILFYTLKKSLSCTQRCNQRSRVTGESLVSLRRDCLRSEKPLHIRALHGNPTLDLNKQPDKRKGLYRVSARIFLPLMLGKLRGFFLRVPTNETISRAPHLGTLPDMIMTFWLSISF